MALVENIEQLRDIVKISASIPFGTVVPFLNTAEEVYLVRFLGRSLVNKLKLEVLDENYNSLYEKAVKAEGLLAMWLGNSELSVRISDSGFTVERTDSLAPASDTKIAQVKESLCIRAFQHLDIVLQYLEENPTLFPEWVYSHYYASRYKNYLKSARQFQNFGSVNIDYSLLRYEEMRPLMQQVEERYVRELIGVELNNELRALDTTPDENKSVVLDYARKFIANKTAEIYTSENSNRNASASNRVDYNPLIRPVYYDLPYTGNFYADQAAFYYAKLEASYNDYLESIGQEVKSGALEWNDDEKSLFIDIG